MTYAIVKLGGKQYRVQEGEYLLVDRLAVDENKTFHPEVLFVGGDGQAELSPSGVQVTAKVLAHEKGKKIVIGKYKKRTGYKRHTGFRASLTQIEIESIGGAKSSRSAAKPKAEAVAKAEPAAKGEPAGAETEERVKGMPSGYEDMTVADIKQASSGWNRPMLEAALEYEQAHAQRKGAIAALESALADKEGDS